MCLILSTLLYAQYSVNNYRMKYTVHPVSSGLNSFHGYCSSGNSINNSIMASVAIRHKSKPFDILIEIRGSWTLRRICEVTVQLAVWCWAAITVFSSFVILSGVSNAVPHRSVTRPSKQAYSKSLSFARENGQPVNYRTAQTPDVKWAVIVDC